MRAIFCMRACKLLHAWMHTFARTDAFVVFAAGKSLTQKTSTAHRGHFSQWPQCVARAHLYYYKQSLITIIIMLHTITDELIRQFYPNVLLPAKGEQPISLKLQPYLEAAEEWVIATFLSSAVAELVAAEHADVDHIVLSIVIHEGMRRAIPELDLVLMPNGFGIVSSSSIAPASRERVEHLTCRAPLGYHYTRLTSFGRVFLPVVALCAVDNYELWTEAQRLDYLASLR